MLIPKPVLSIAHATTRSGRHPALDNVLFRRDAHGDPEAIASTGRVIAHVMWPESPNTEFPDPKGGKLFRESLTFGDGTGVLVPATALLEAQRNVPKSIKPILEHVHLAERQDPVTLTTTDLTRTRVIEEFVDTERDFPDVDTIFASLRDRVKASPSHYKVSPFRLKEATEIFLKIWKPSDIDSDPPFLDAYTGKDFMRLIGGENGLVVTVYISLIERRENS